MTNKTDVLLDIMEFLNQLIEKSEIFLFLSWPASCVVVSRPQGILMMHRKAGGVIFTQHQMQGWETSSFNMCMKLY